MLTSIFSRLLILVFGILNPAYRSYKSLRAKNQKEIITWLMYWIVFAMFTAVETITDWLISWFPFYYEGKIAFVLWMVLPVTRGYSMIFRKLIHPELVKREIEIDEIIEKATEKGYSALLNFGAKGINFAASTVLTTAVRGQELLASRSLSMGDLTQRLTGTPSTSTDDQLEGVFDELDDAIAGHGDTIQTNRISVRPRTYNRRNYDSGTFPKRRSHGSQLNEVPEEDSIIDEPTDKRRERMKVSQSRKPVPAQWKNKYTPVMQPDDNVVVAKELYVSADDDKDVDVDVDDDDYQPSDISDTEPINCNESNNRYMTRSRGSVSRRN